MNLSKKIILKLLYIILLFGAVAYEITKETKHKIIDSEYSVQPFFKNKA